MNIQFRKSALLVALIAPAAQAHTSASSGQAHMVEHLWIALVPVALWGLWRLAARRGERSDK